MSLLSYAAKILPIKGLAYTVYLHLFDFKNNAGLTDPAPNLGSLLIFPKTEGFTNQSEKSIKEVDLDNEKEVELLSGEEFTDLLISKNPQKKTIEGFSVIKDITQATYRYSVLLTGIFLIMLLSRMRQERGNSTLSIWGV